MTWAIRTERLTKAYRIYTRPFDRLRELAFLGLRPHHEEMVALRDVDLEIQQGTTVGIIGRNGAGKSTLLKILSGNLAPTSGRVSVRGRVSSILELGMGFQPGLTGRQNSRINALLLGLRPREIEACLPIVAEFSELGDAIDRPLSTYSTGMVGRLAFSILSAVRSEVIILDEALAAGDAGFVAKGRKLIRQFRDSGSTVLVVSHDMRVIRDICERVVWIDHGVVQADGDPEEVVGRYLRAVPELSYMFAALDTRNVAPTRLLLRLTPAGEAPQGASYPLASVEWREVRERDRAPRGLASLHLETNLEESVRGARENGLDGETARLGWGPAGEVEGRATRMFQPRIDQPVILVVNAPQRSQGGPLELSFCFCDTQAVPLRVELVTAGTPRLLGELFGAGDGAWKERAFALPTELRFDTLPALDQAPVLAAQYETTVGP